MDFYLGTHKANWLGQVTATPLFLSRRTLAERKSLPQATTRWALDSGGFSELSLHRGWTIPPPQYVAEVRRFANEVGNLEWAAAQDWMCEPFMVERTGLSVAEHQRRTLDNYRELCDLAPELPIVPVLQGWQPEEYLRHREMYLRAGVDLAALPRVGLGSVCRRQHSRELVRIVALFPDLQLHAFGVKLQGIDQVARQLASADSLAWSYDARRQRPLPGCPHRSCANCLRFALLWRERVLRRIRRAREAPRQLTLLFGDTDA